MSQETKAPIARRVDRFRLFAEIEGVGPCVSPALPYVLAMILVNEAREAGLAVSFEQATQRLRRRIEEEGIIRMPLEALVEAINERAPADRQLVLKIRDAGPGESLIDFEIAGQAMPVDPPPAEPICSAEFAEIDAEISRQQPGRPCTHFQIGFANAAIFEAGCLTPIDEVLVIDCVAAAPGPPLAADMPDDDYPFEPELEFQRWLDRVPLPLVVSAAVLIVGLFLTWFLQGGCS